MTYILFDKEIYKLAFKSDKDVMLISIKKPKSNMRLWMPLKYFNQIKKLTRQDIIAEIL